MCNFVSWIEYGGNIYYLQNSDLTTKEGKDLIEYTKDYDDIKGHGAIDKYYGLNGKGIHKECEDFSTPDNFPKEIQEKLKNGEMADIGIAIDILNPKAKKECINIIDKAFQEYEKIRDKASQEYENIRDKAYQEYEKISVKEYREYEKIIDKADKEYCNIKDKAYKEYRNIISKTYRQLVKQKKNRIKAWK